MNSLKSFLVKNDDNDIDNYLLFKISSENNNISNKIYNKYIQVPTRNADKIRRSIERRFQNKIDNLGIKHNISFPYNLRIPRYNSQITVQNKDDIYLYGKEYGRLYNWIETAINFPFLRKFIKKTQSCNGQFSPHTHIDLWTLSTIGSPGKVNYLLSRLFYQSNYFIKLFDKNFSPSYLIIAHCITNKFENSRFNGKVKPSKKDALKVAVHTLLTYHPFITKIDDSNLTNINRIFLGGICEFLDEYELVYVRNRRVYDHFILSYRKSVEMLTLLIKIKNNDITELALKCI